MVIDSWIRDKISLIPKGNSLLDVGAGQCKFKDNCKHLKYISQDLCKYDGIDEGKWDYNNIDIKSDITKIPLKSKSIDAVLCTDVFEHIPDAVKAVKEITRLLKKGGKLIISTPFSCNIHQLPYFFSSGYHMNWYKYHLKKYKILETNTDGNYFTQIKQELERMVTPILRKLTSYSLDNSDIGAINGAIAVIDRMSAKGGMSSNFLCGSYQVYAEKK